MKDIEGGMKPAPMPVRYVVEMFMDRVAACKVYNKDKYKDSDPLAYFNSGKNQDLLHPKTRKQLETLLRMLATRGEDETFAYIRRRILKKSYIL